MNRHIIIGFLFISLTLLVACGSRADEEDNASAEPVDAQLSIPGSIPVNEKTRLNVRVSQGEGAVEDADEVTFELWKENNQEDSELIEAQHEKGGVYTIDKNFSGEGFYYVQAHVTARGTHVMPMLPFIVGEASIDEVAKLEKEKKELKESSTSNEERGHHHH